jgi:hypothetical protein
MCVSKAVTGLCRGQQARQDPVMDGIHAAILYHGTRIRDYI